MPIKWVKTNIKQAATSWRTWRSLTEQRKTITKTRKLEKMDDRISVARRDFFASSAKLAGSGLLLSILGTGGSFALKHFINISDPLRHAYKKSGTGFPFAFDHLNMLVNESGLSPEEIEDILLKNPGQEGLYTLMAYGLLRRAKKNGELSKRYNIFLDTMSNFIASGKVNFKMAESLSVPHGMMEYNRAGEKGIIKVRPKKISEVTDPVIIEATILHELFHCFQDHKKKAVRISQLEAEAHLLASDYLLHVQPELRPKNFWIKIYTLKNSYNIEFFVPQSVVKSLQDLDEGNPFFDKTVLTIRQAYLLYDIMCQSIIPGADKDIFDQTSGFSKEEVYKGIIIEIDQMAGELKTKPLQEYLYDCKPGKIKDNSIKCRIKEALAQYSTFVDFLANYAGASGDFHLMEQYYNLYYIEKWMDKRGSLLDSSYDRMVTNKGFN